MTELDSAGRLLVPHNLKEHAGLEKDIVLVSAVNKIEIWDKSKYQQFFESFSPEAFSSLAKQVMAELRKYFGEKLCATSIPRNIRLAEAPSHGKPALLYDVRSRGAESYIRLAKEIIAHYFPQAGEEPPAAGEPPPEEMGKTA